MEMMDPERPLEVTIEKVSHLYLALISRTDTYARGVMSYLTNDVVYL